MAMRWAAGAAKNLDKLLEAAEVKNVDLARALGVHPSTISKYRSGERVPGADELAVMIEAAHGSADVVLGLRPATIDPAVLRAVVHLSRKVVEAAPQLPEQPAPRSQDRKDKP